MAGLGEEAFQHTAVLTWPVKCNHIPKSLVSPLKRSLHHTKPITSSSDVPCGSESLPATFSVFYAKLRNMEQRNSLTYRAHYTETEEGEKKKKKEEEEKKSGKQQREHQSQRKEEEEVLHGGADRHCSPCRTHAGAEGYS